MLNDGRLLVVEGAQPLHRARTGRSQGHVLAHDVLDRRTLLDERDVVGLDPTRHWPSLSRPSLGGASRRRWPTSTGSGMPRGRRAPGRAPAERRPSAGHAAYPDWAMAGREGKVSLAFTSPMLFRRTTPVIRRRTALLALATTATLALTACGGDGSLEAGKSLDPDKLTIYSAQHENLTQAWAKKFQEDTGVKVQIRYGGDSSMGAQIVQEGAKSPADVFLTENSPAMTTVQNAGLLAKVDDATIAQVGAEYAPVDAGVGRHRGPLDGARLQPEQDHRGRAAEVDHGPAGPEVEGQVGRRRGRRRLPGHRVGRSSRPRARRRPPRGSRASRTARRSTRTTSR